MRRGFLVPGFWFLVLSPSRRANRNWKHAILLGVALLTAGSAFAQDAKEGEIAVNMVVNYSFAYRENTWAPVNVFVQNQLRDFKGCVEVRCYSGDISQAPYYRVPAECPKGSKKRFQLCCYLGGTTRIEVHLYNGDREVLDFPAQLDINPIRNADYMGLVLDEDATGFGFLSSIVNRVQGAEGEEGERRFYREAAPSSALPLLATHPQCYTPFDVIILGNVDPNGVSERHRELFYDYVRGGGALVVCTGEYAAKYHGSWVEELLGASVGGVETVNEKALAEAVFPETQREGARDFRDCIVASLAPTDSGVERMGASRTLATRRKIGSGCVYGIAVDADSHALQSCKGYEDLWRGIVMRKGGGDTINFKAAAQYTAMALPRISGIVIHSRASVVTYLGLYFFVAVVLNFLVFTVLKRREWAWAVLIVCSMGFTAYAVVFGTAGRAQSSEVQRIETLHVPKGGGLASLYADIALLDARSRTHSVDLGGEYTLATAVSNPRPDYWDPRTRGLGNERPFYLVESDTPRVEGFQVGASEVRLLHLESDLETSGGVDGQIELLDGGQVKADLVNNTGYALKNAFVFVDGQTFPAKVSGNRCTVDARNYRVLDGIVAPNFQYTGSNYYGGTRYARDTSVEQLRNQALASFRKEFPNELLTKSAFNYYWYGGGRPYNTEAGPFLCGWVDGPCLSTADAGPRAKQTIGETFFMADVDVVRHVQTAVWVSLPVCADATNISGRYESIGGEPAPTYIGNCKDPIRVYIPFTSEILERAPKSLIVETHTRSLHNHTLVFRPVDAPPTWSESHRVKDLPSQSDNSGNGSERALYRFEQWDRQAKPMTEELRKDWIAALDRYRNTPKVAFPGSASAARDKAMDLDVNGVERMIEGVVVVDPKEAACVQDNAQANEVAITARVMVQPRDDRTGDASIWQ